MDLRIGRDRKIPMKEEGTKADVETTLVAFICCCCCCWERRKIRTKQNETDKSTVDGHGDIAPNWIDLTTDDKCGPRLSFTTPSENLRINWETYVAKEYRHLTIQRRTDGRAKPKNTWEFVNHASSSGIQISRVRQWTVEQERITYIPRSTTNETLWNNRPKVAIKIRVAPGY